MTGSVLQFSESTVDSIQSNDDGSVSVRFDTAFVVKSEGIPYADASTLWTQAGTIVIEEGELDGAPPDLPAALRTGSMEYNGYKFLDMVQIPLQAEGYAGLELVFAGESGTLSVRGSGVHLELEDSARYVKHMDVPTGQAGEDE